MSAKTNRAKIEPPVSTSLEPIAVIVHLDTLERTAKQVYLYKECYPLSIMKTAFQKFKR